MTEDVRPPMGPELIKLMISEIKDENTLTELGLAKHYIRMKEIYASYGDDFQHIQEYWDCTQKLHQGLLDSRSGVI